HAREAQRILREDVCDRSDDGEAPMELPERTESIIRSHDWLTRGEAQLTRWAPLGVPHDGRGRKSSPGRLTGHHLWAAPVWSHFERLARCQAPLQGRESLFVCKYSRAGQFLQQLEHVSVGLTGRSGH